MLEPPPVEEEEEEIRTGLDLPLVDGNRLSSHAGHSIKSPWHILILLLLTFFARRQPSQRGIVSSRAMKQSVNSTKSELWSKSDKNTTGIYFQIHYSVVL